MSNEDEQILRIFGPPWKSTLGGRRTMIHHPIRPGPPIIMVRPKINNQKPIASSNSNVKANSGRNNQMVTLSNSNQNSKTSSNTKAKANSGRSNQMVQLTSSGRPTQMVKLSNSGGSSRVVNIDNTDKNENVDIKKELNFIKTRIEAAEKVNQNLAEKLDSIDKKLKDMQFSYASNIYARAVAPPSNDMGEI